MTLTDVSPVKKSKLHILNVKLQEEVFNIQKQL